MRCMWPLTITVHMMWCINRIWQYDWIDAGYNKWQITTAVQVTWFTNRDKLRIEKNIYPQEISARNLCRFYTHKTIWSDIKVTFPVHIT